MSLWNAVRSVVLGKSSRKMFTRCPRKVTNKSQDSRPVSHLFPSIRTLFSPSLSSVLSPTPRDGFPSVDTMHGSRTNDVKTSRDGSRACDFFVGISGRNLICLIGVGPAGWEITGAKFEQSCTLERRKFIGVTPVSSTVRESLIFVANIAQCQVCERESISLALKTLMMHFFPSWIYVFFFLLNISIFAVSAFSSATPLPYSNFLNIRSLCLCPAYFCNEWG